MAFLTAFAMLTPAFALANGGHNDKNNDNRGRNELRASNSSVNEFGVHVFGDENRNNKNHDKNDDNNKDKNKDKGDFKEFQGQKDFFPSLFYSGKVISVDGNSFVIETKSNQSFTVQAGSAKVVRIPRTVIAVSDIQVGDRVNITGTKSGVTITASVVYDFSQNLKPAMAKGTVTVTASNTLTVDAGGTLPLTVNVDEDTKVVTSDHTEGTLSDVSVDSEIKVVGFWDSVLNVFNAIKIKLL